MQWAAATHGPEGKVLADGRTLEYIGRGQHARDAMCVRTTQPVSSMSYVHHHRTTVATNTTRQSNPPSHAKPAAAQPPRVVQDHVQRTHSSSDNVLSALRLFYYETLIVSSCDDDDNHSTSNNGNGNASDGAVPLDTRAELDLLMARVNGLARSSSSSSSQRATSPPLASATTSSSATTAHPFADAHTGSTRLPWRARARRIVQANLLASEPLLHPANPNEVNDGTSERMDLDDDDTRSSNGNRAAARATDQASAASRDRSTTTMRHRTSGVTNNRGGSTATSDRGATDAPSLLSSSTLHFAFTLSSRTLQQIRSRHERRRARRHEALKRFNHRIAVGFAFTTPTTAMTSHSGASPDRECASQPSTSTTSKAAVAHEDLGTDAHSLAYEGKTGRIVSNGHVFLQCERFGAGDVVGCGLLVDTQTFFFTLNGRLLGLLAATDVHHLDALVDTDDTVRSLSVKTLTTSTRVTPNAATDSDSDDDTGAFDPDNSDTSSSDTDDDHHSLDTTPPAFDDVVFPAVSLHSAGECVSAAFTSFQFDLPAFAQQIQKERQLALVLHETADERDDRATDDVLHDLVLEYFSHFGYENAYRAFAATNSSSSSGAGRSTKTMDVDSDEHKASELTDAALLHVRHCVRQHVYAYKTAQALDLLTAALGHDFIPAAAAVTARGATVLFYMRVLCVLDVLLGPSGASQLLDPSRSDARLSPHEPHSSNSNNWRVEDAIACAQELFARDAMSAGPSRTSASVADTELPLVLTLLLYERKDDVPVDSAAHKFLTPAFREHVADELNLLVLAHAASYDQQRKTVNRRAPAALQQFLEERQMLETQCLQHGCRVFPGNHTVSGVRAHGSSRKASRRHHHRHHRLSLSSSSETGGNDDDDDYDDYDDDDDDEHMRSSSSGSDVSSSSSRSDRNDGEHDDDEDDDAMDEDDE